MATPAVRTTQHIARPLKVLIPLIQSELQMGNDAGLDHYRRAGTMLLEAREQLSGGSWTAWLSKNFELSRMTAHRYMKLAERVAIDGGRIPRDTTLKDAIGERVTPRLGAWAPIRDRVEKVNVDRFAEERQARDDETKLHRDLALQLIDLGYRALATRLHPDRGGSRDAMSRLNRVRDELKSIAETRRFL
jgi:hypothetical protein